MCVAPTASGPGCATLPLCGDHEGGEGGGGGGGGVRGRRHWWRATDGGGGQMGGARGRRTDSTGRHWQLAWRSAASRYGRGRGRLRCRGWRVRRLGRPMTHARSEESEHSGAAAGGLLPAVRVAAVPWRRKWRCRWRSGRRRAVVPLLVQGAGWGGRGGDGPTLPLATGDGGGALRRADTRGRGRLWRRGWRVRRLGRSATHARSGASEHGGAAADGLPPAVRVAAVPWRWGWRWRWWLGRRRAGAALWVQGEGWDGRGGDGCGSEGGSGGGGGRGRRCWWRVTDGGRGKETD